MAWKVKIMKFATSLIALFAIAFCLPASAAAATITISPAQALMHEDVEIRLDRLQPRQLVTLRAELVDRRRIVWRSEAVMRADARGRIDVARSAALSGTYRGIDRYGLFWSMEPVAGGGEAFVRAASEPRHSLVPVLRHTEPFTIEIQALADGVELGRATLARRWSDQRTRAVEIEEGQVRGILYEPAAAGPHPGLVLITGSGGGVDEDWAPLLAARGYSVLALGYFQYKDRPAYPADLPIEYFAEALRWMQNRIGHQRIGMLGISRGTEAAMLTAAHYPDLVRAVVAVAPGHLSTAGFHPDRGLAVSTWSIGGQALPYSAFPDFDMARLAVDHGDPARPLRQAEWYSAMYARPGESDRFGIPVERMRAPILLLSGGEDAIWPSRLAGERIAARLAQNNYPFEVRRVVLEGAGHGIWMSPNLVTSYAHLGFHQLARAFTTDGGTPSANARGAREAFRAADDFLRRHLGRPARPSGTR